MATAHFQLHQLNYFTNGNRFSGSLKGFNYLLIPNKADPDAGTAAHVAVQVWYGMLCSDLSEMVATTQVPMDADGVAAAEAWLEEQYVAYITSQE